MWQIATKPRLVEKEAVLSHLNLRNLAIPLIAACALLDGCTSVRVKPVGAENHIDHICIQNNPRVLVVDFVSVMQEGFQKYGITSQTFTEPAPRSCLYTATYTALRSWDFAPYMTDAQIDILRDGRPIASANYHLKGKGGLSFNKWANTSTKILPIIDTLLAQVTRPTHVVTTGSDAPPVAQAHPAEAAPPSGELARRLSQLKDAFDAHLITRDEYDAKKKELLAEL